MTIAVTGATGQLGTLVVTALLDRGVAADQVVALVRSPEKAAALADRGVTVRAFDYDSADAAALAGVDRLLLISGTEFGKRAQQHAAVIDVAAAAGVGIVYYTSVEAGEAGPEASVNPVSPEHAATEAHLAGAAVRGVVLRNGWYHENYLANLQSAGATGTVLTSAGDGKVASASRADFADAAAAALLLEDPAPLYRLTGDTAWSTEDLAADLSTVLGREITVTRVDADAQRAALAGTGLDEGTVGFVVAVDEAIARGELGAVTGELSALTGRPTTPLVDVLRQG